MRISIVTICYNSAKTIRQTLESVTSQLKPGDEYIIIDGGSKDDTLKIVEEFSEHITKLVSEPDNGISDAFNKGVKNATGDVIGIINSDDLLLPGALDVVRQEFTDDIDVLYGKTVTLRDGAVCDASDSQKIVPLKELKYRMCIAHPATFVKKSAYDKFGLFRCELRYSMDRDLLLRMYLGGAKFKAITDKLAGFSYGGVSGDNFIKTAKESRKVSIHHGSSGIISAFYLIRQVLVFKIMERRSR